MSIDQMRERFLTGCMSELARAYGAFVIFGLMDQPVGVIVFDASDSDLIPYLWHAGIVVFESHVWDGSQWITTTY